MARIALLAAALCALSHSVQSATVRETLYLTWEEGAPNGQSREMIFTNGQFPAPNLIFEEDDDVEVFLFSLLHLIPVMKTIRKKVSALTSL